MITNQNQVAGTRSNLETYILGHLILVEDFDPPSWVKPDHFADPFHSRLFHIYKNKKTHNLVVDINTMRHAYTQEHERRKMEDYTRIINLRYSIQYDINVAFSELRDYFIKQRTLELAVNVKGQKDPAAYARMKLDEALESCIEKEERKLEDAITESLDDIQERIQYVREGKEIPNVIYTGIKSVDKMLGGIYSGENVVIAGTTGMGKSTFARMLSINNAKKPILYFTLEMKDKQILEKMACTIAEVDQMRLRNGSLSDNEYSRWVEAMANLSKLNLTFETIGSMHDFSDAVKIWRRNTDQEETGIVIIDYVQQITNDLKGRTRDQEIQQISRLIKILADSENCVMFTFAQLSRAVEKRGGDKRPLLSDLRESGTIEQDADIVAFMYRPEYYGFETDDEGSSTLGMAEMIIRKSRNGMTGNAKMQFIGKYGKIGDWTQGEDNFGGFTSTLVVPNSENQNIPF